MFIARDSNQLYRYVHSMSDALDPLQCRVKRSTLHESAGVEVEFHPPNQNPQLAPPHANNDRLNFTLCFTVFSVGIVNLPDLSMTSSTMGNLNLLKLTLNTIRGQLVVYEQVIWC